MSSESNKLLCAILSTILVLLLASFISELLYNKEKKKNKLSYSIEQIEDDVVKSDSKKIESEIKKISELEINQLLEKANLEEGKNFVNKNCASCHNFNLPIKNKIGPSLATILIGK